jgi:hypothetical protein
MSDVILDLWCLLAEGLQNVILIAPAGPQGLRI